MSPSQKRTSPHVALATSWIEPEHLVGILDYARQAGWTLDIVNAERAGRLKGMEADGALVQLHPDHKALVRGVRQLGVPLVEFGHINPLRTPVAVALDFEEMGRRTAEHFLARGFRQLGYVTGGLRFGDEVLRHRGFAAVAEAAGAVVHLIDYAGEDTPAGAVPGRRPHQFADGTEEDWRHWLAREVDALPLPVGILTSHVPIAVDLVDGCVEAGLLVPEQIAVVTFCATPALCDLCRVPLSQIWPDYRSQAYEAARILDRLMTRRRKPKAAGPILLQTFELLVRRSSDVQAVAHAQAAQAVHTISEHLADPRLAPDLLAERLEISLSRLYRLFRDQVGRTPAAEIERQRVRVASRLLRQTDHTAAAVAAECGFGQARRLRRALQRATGLSVQAYRARCRAQPNDPPAVS